MLEFLFNKVSGLSGVQLYLKETPTQVVSCAICEILKNNYSHRTPPVVASVFRILVSIKMKFGQILV